jgi:hypothetical protein
MRPRHWKFPDTIDNYQLQLRLVTVEVRQQPLWDRSGAGRKFALRRALLEQLARRPADAPRH